MAYTKYSLTPADNNAAPPNGAPEGMLPSAVNDTMRDMMAQIRDVGDGIRGGTYTMTAPVITGGSITGVALSGNTFTSPIITGGSINNTPIGASTANTGAFTTLGATGVATFSAGTVSAPAITTTGDTNTGIFFPAADTIAFTEGGVESMRIDSSGNVGIGTSSPSNKLDVSGTGDIKTTIQSTSSGSGANVGLSLKTPADGEWLIQAGNVVSGGLRINNATGERMRIDSSGNCGIGTSSPAVRLAGTVLSINGTSQSSFELLNAGVSAGEMFSTSSGTFVNEHRALPLIFRTNGGTERMRIDSSGNVGIGFTGSADQRLATRGSDTTSSNYAFVASNSAAATLFATRNDGLILTGTAAFSPYNNTTGAAANVALDAGGLLYRSTSSLKYKTNVQDATHGLDEVLQLRPVTYKGKNDGDTIFGGLIAEEVDAIGLKEFVQYANDGSPDALAYGNMVSLLAKAIQEQQTLIENLTTRLNALEGK